MFLRRFRSAVPVVYLPMLKAGVSIVKYGRRSRVDLYFFYVVSVSRSRIRNYVVCVRIETTDVLATSVGAMHAGKFPGRRMRI